MRALAALIGDGDVERAGEEGRLAQPLLERRVVEVEALEDLGVGHEGDRGAVLAGRLALLDRAHRRAAHVGLAPDEAVAAHLGVQTLRQRVDDRHADAVQTAGDLIAPALAELAARVQDRQDDLEGGLALFGHRRDRDAGAVVDHRDRVVGMNRHRDEVVAAGQRLVDGVVDDLVDEMVQSPLTGRADVHAGAFADGLEALEHLDVLGVVCLRCGALLVGAVVVRQRSSD